MKYRLYSLGREDLYKEALEAGWKDISETNPGHRCGLFWIVKKDHVPDGTTFDNGNYDNPEDARDVAYTMSICELNNRIHKLEEK